MTIRVNGYSHDSRLGYFQGDNAIVSIVVPSADLADATKAVNIKATGCMMSLAEFKRMYARDESEDIAADITMTRDRNNDGDFDDTNETWTEKNIDEDLRKINGTTYANDAAYIAAHAAQENLKRLVDTIQQRAVIIATSKSGLQFNAANTLGASWSKPLVTLAAGGFHGVSFLIERATVFDKMRPNTYGQPESTTPVVGGELVEALNGLPLLFNDGSTLTVKVDDATLANNNLAFKVEKTLPRGDL